MEKKRIIICGAGSIGIYLGAKLNKHKVILFGRRKLKGIKDKVIIKNKTYKIPRKVFNIPENKKYDFIFITTKLYDFGEMVDLIKKKKLDSPVIASVQNGLVDSSKYNASFKNKRLIPVVVFSGFNLVKDRIIVKSTPVGWRTEDSEEGRKIAELLKDGKIQCYAEPNLDVMRAEKTIINSCLNGLSAIEKKPFNDLFKNKETRRKIENLFHESYAILRKKYRLDKKEEIRKRMYKHWSKLSHYSSTYQDLVSGRKVEIEFFNGYLVNLGKKYKLPTKYNEQIILDFKKMSGA